MQFFMIVLQINGPLFNQEFINDVLHNYLWISPELNLGYTCACIKMCRLYAELYERMSQMSAYVGRKFIADSKE